MMSREGLEKSKIVHGNTYKDLHRLLTNFSDTTEYKIRPGKRCCHKQSLQKIYPLLKEDTAETARLSFLTELKLKELLTGKKFNREDICNAETKLV